MNELLTLLRDDLIFTKMVAKSREEALSYLSKHLYEKGFVKESFCEAIINREKKYPTGLQIREGGVAIPHTESSHVHKDAIAVGVLITPVSFQRMDIADQLVEVEVIFMLALSQNHGHLQVLSELMNVFQLPSIFRGIKQAIHGNEIVEIIRNLQPYEKGV